MAKKAPCKCKAPECEECPEWIFTFADLVMLMMGFFVILWVLKPAPSDPSQASKDILPLEVIDAIRREFGHVPDPNSTDPIDVRILMKKIESLKSNKGPGDGGKTRLDKTAPDGTDPEPQMIRSSRQLGTGAKVLFAPGDARLTPESSRSLDQIAEIVRGYRSIFIIKGHASADDYPDNTPEAMKMALSLKRAEAAADYLITKGVDRETIRVQGCSTFEPLVQRAYTVDVKQQNRRVEVESTQTLVKELQDAPKAAGHALPPTPAQASTPLGH